jgi:hypothetical protein
MLPLSLAGSQRETVQACLFSKPVEFDGFKTRVIQVLPDAQELDGIAPWGQSLISD